jgi:hypothetical protein
MSLPRAFAPPLLQVILFWYASKLKPGFAEVCMVEGACPEDQAQQLWAQVAVSVALCA